MPQTPIKKTHGTDPASRPPYCTPTIQRVDLALEETLSSGCKVWGANCADDELGTVATFDDGS